MKKLILNLIRFYQKHLSLKNIGIDVCIYEPSCSQYTLEAVDRFGILKGSLLGFIRVLRCNPFGKGGYDPLENSYLAKSWLRKAKKG